MSTVVMMPLDRWCSERCRGARIFALIIATAHHHRRAEFELGSCQDGDQTHFSQRQCPTDEPSRRTPFCPAFCDDAESAAMSQADAENSRLPPKRPLGASHLLRDLRERRSSFRMCPELAHVFLCPRSLMSSLSLCHYRYSRRIWLGGITTAR